MKSAIDHKLELLPAPVDVHRRLGEVLREANLLRRLLKLSTEAEAERRRRTEVSANATVCA
jgi:hypothetical protein